MADFLFMESVFQKKYFASAQVQNYSGGPRMKSTHPLT
jgi:hypothetical protein